MRVNSKYTSPLILKKIEVTDASFHRKEYDISNLELDLSVEKKIDEIDENTYRVSLKTDVHDDDSFLNVSVTTIGIFETDQKYHSLVESNAIAIMFPFVRSYITSLTTQPGMEPIVLPAINVLSLVKDNGAQDDSWKN